MNLYEQEFNIPVVPKHKNLIAHFWASVKDHLSESEIPVRFVVTHTDNNHYRSELGTLTAMKNVSAVEQESIFRFIHRKIENTDHFNTVLIVPTGIGAEIGGHAGDSAPVARLLSSICDTIITHPNVVNASDINEIPENALYVEGSVISRLLMGTVGLQPVRSNRVLVVIDAHKDEIFVNAAINSVSGARASYGFQCSGVVQLDPPIKMKSQYTSSGRAVGRVERLKELCNVLDEYRGQYDAIAISSVIDVPYNYHMDYFLGKGDMVNPWGGVEAMLTHAVSLLYDIPSAHSPMFESQEIANMDPGVVDPRMAAEAVSVTFLQSVLKGLKRSPKIITDRMAMHCNNVISAEDISCLVIPDWCVGLPTLAALEQGISVIAVRENKNVMKNDLTALPWAPGQFYLVENYWEAAGVIAAIKEGIAPESVRRPLLPTAVVPMEKKTPRETVYAKDDTEVNMDRDNPSQSSTAIDSDCNPQGETILQKSC